VADDRFQIMSIPSRNPILGQLPHLISCHVSFPSSFEFVFIEYAIRSPSISVVCQNPRFPDEDFASDHHLPGPMPAFTITTAAIAGALIAWGIKQVGRQG
jgi:hypothetical protein